MKEFTRWGWFKTVSVYPQKWIKQSTRLTVPRDFHHGAAANTFQLLSHCLTSEREPDCDRGHDFWWDLCHMKTIWLPPGDVLLIYIRMRPFFFPLCPRLLRDSFAHHHFIEKQRKERMKNKICDHNGCLSVSVLMLSPFSQIQSLLLPRDSLTPAPAYAPVIAIKTAIALMSACPSPDPRHSPAALLRPWSGLCPCFRTYFNYLI